MSFTQLKSWFTLTLTLCLLTTSAQAQQQFHGPFIDFDEFNPDYQFFAPMDDDEFGKYKANYGWFFQYDKMYVGVTRPEAQLAKYKLDATWGDRVDFGYMSEQKTGWMFSVFDIEGPNQFQVRRAERLNRLIEDEDDNGGGGGGGGGDDQLPPQDENNPITGGRDFLLNDSINAGRFNGFEMNKVWRLGENDKGQITEPFIGLRYVKFRDTFRDDEYQRFTDDGTPIPPIPDPNDPDSPAPDEAAIEQYTQVQAISDNEMFGGQFGMRWFHKPTTHWMLSGEIKFFAMHNFQTYQDTRYILYTQGDIGIGGETETETNQKESTWGSGAEFTWGGELRADASYEITRDLSLKFGFNWMQFGQGISRGGNRQLNSEDLGTYGFTFGVTLNR